MTRRRLRPDEIELWQQVADTAERLTPERATKGPESHPPHPKPKPQRTIQPHKDFTLGAKAQRHAAGHDLLPPVQDRIAAAPLRMDKKAFARLKRGKMRPEGKLDLHGMTMAQAHPALTRFILTAHADGKRLVLVVTGKGKNRDDGGPIPVRHGVLRHNVPQWLAMAPLSSVVLQISEAHLKHGGGGAYYVYLQRR